MSSCISSCSSIRQWHVVISGFLQRQGHPNGMLRLAMQLHRQYASNDCMVELRLWQEDMKGLAEKIWLTRPADSRPPRVKIYGYSWGGAAALQLAEQLWDRSIDVEYVVLSDAVYRHRYWLGNWRACWPFSSLIVPPNVRRVAWYRQRRNWPRGHDVIAATPHKTDITNGAILDATHAYMDDAPQFIAKCLEVAAG